MPPIHSSGTVNSGLPVESNDNQARRCDDFRKRPAMFLHLPRGAIVAYNASACKLSHNQQNAVIMTLEIKAEHNTPASWFAVAGIVAIHLLAFGGLYLTLVQLSWVVQDHYAAVGMADTAEFSSLRSISGSVASYTFLFVGLMFVETFVAARSTRRRRSWASAYSHAVIFSIGFAMFVSFAWIIHPMGRSVQNLAVANPALAPLDDSVAAK